MRVKPDAKTQKLTPEFLNVAGIYAREYRGKAVVIKVGGEVIDNEDPTVLDDVLHQASVLRLFGCEVMIVHGGGKQIDKAMAERKIAVVRDHNESRIAGPETIDISIRVGAEINRNIVHRLNKIASDTGVRGLGLTGADGIVRARPVYEGYFTGALDIEKLVREGGKESVAKIVKVDFLKNIFRDKPGEPNLIPVIDWHAMGPNGTTLTLNADDAAGAIAIGMEAKRLLFFSTDRTGKILGVHNKEGKLITDIAPDEVDQLIRNKTVQGGMKPKVKVCRAVVNAGVEGVVILNPCIKDNIVNELLLTKQGTGTLFKNPSQPEKRTPKLPKALREMQIR